MSEKYDPKITVCDHCFEASCWQGIFMCDDAYSAGTIEKNVSDLISITSEHPDYWNNQLNFAGENLLTPAILESLGAKGERLELSEEPGTL